MNWYPPLLVLVVLALTPRLSVAQGDLVLIANASLDPTQIDRATVRRIYLGDQRGISGQRVIATVNSASDALFKRFALEIMGMSGSRLRGFWAQLRFSGRGEPPREFHDIQRLLEYIATTPGSLGFVDQETELPIEVVTLVVRVDG